MLYHLRYGRLEICLPSLPSERRAHLACTAAEHRADLAGLEPAVLTSGDPMERSPREQTDDLYVRPRGLCCRRRARMHPIKSGVAQWLARWAHSPQVCGSKPCFAFVSPPSQSLERLTADRFVPSSHLGACVPVATPKYLLCTSLAGGSGLHHIRYSLAG